MNEVLNYILNNKLSRKFYEEYVHGINTVYKRYEMKKNHFLHMFIMRYETNLEVNKVELIGGRQLIENLQNYKGEDIICHTIEKGTNDVSVFSDVEDKIFFGFLLKKEGKVHGESLLNSSQELSSD